MLLEGFGYYCHKPYVMDSKIRLLFLCILISIHLPSLNADHGKSEEGLSEKAKVAGEFLKEDARVVLAKTGIGSSYRKKREKSESNDHSLEAESLELDSAKESVEAAGDVVSAVIETEEALQTAQENLDQSHHFHTSEDHEGSNSITDENDESDSNDCDDSESDEDLNVFETESVESTHSSDEHEGISTDLTHHDHDQEHQHDHGHDHLHQQDQDHDHDHEHQQDHEHQEDHDHDQHQQGHTHEHDYEHQHDHVHQHDHEHQEDHDHDHEHQQDHAHQHDHEHQEDHDHEHNREHQQDHDHHRESLLQKLMSDSSDIAKEIRMVFDILSKREAELVEEMERLKFVLAGAVTVLKKSQHDTNTLVNRQRRMRREFYPDNETPYKACVYIESSPEGQELGSMHKSKPIYPPEPDVREFMTKGGQAHKAAMSASQFDERSQHTSGEDDDVDLSKVYWLKLPESSNEEEMEQKVESVISEVNGEGKDALIIPVSKGFHNSNEVSQGFLKAVQVKPSALKSKYARKLRSLKVKPKQT